MRGFGIVLMLGCCVVHTALAQTRIVTDGSLPGTGVFDLPGVNGLFEIPETLGWRPGSGTNLFHSFQLFDVGTNDTAFFTAGSGLPTRNVLARVTGGVPSVIEGRIASLIPNADVWLMNRSGILFGPGSKLDVPRSFHATSADFLGFEDGSRFYADPGFDASAGSVLDAVAPPDFGLLGAPVSFGFTGDAPADIELDGAVLEVGLRTGFQTLSLVGGGVRIGGSELFVPDGVIRIASVGSAGEVVVSGEGLELVGFEERGELEVVGSELDASGFFDGSIILRGGDVLVLGSTLAVARLCCGGGARGGVGIDIEGENVDLVQAFITAPALPGTTVAGAPIRIAGDSVRIGAQTRIRAQTFPGSAADGGNVTITADRLEVLGELFRTGNPNWISLRVETYGTGRGGDLVLQAREIVLDGAARILVATQGDGQSGNLSVIGGDIRIDNFSELVNAADDGSGDGGDMYLQGDSVLIDDASIVGTQSSGRSTGDAGDLTVRAGRLELRKEAVLQSSAFATGDSGNIDIVADSVRISGEENSIFDDGGTLLSSTAFFVPDAETGKSGDIRIEARRIEVLGGERFGVILSQSDGKEKGGNILLTAEEIFVGFKGNVNASSFGPGEGGRVELVADRVNVAQGVVFASATERGRGGDVIIRGDRVEISGAVSSSASFVGFPPEVSTGDAGDVTIEANQVVVKDGRVASASVTAGSGGRVTVIGHESVLLTDGGELVSSAEGAGDGGTVLVRTPKLDMRDGARIAVESNGDGLAGDAILQVANDLDMQNATILSEAAASEGGEIVLSGRRIQLSESAISASVGGGDGGSVTVQDAGVLVLRDGSSITAQARELGGTGGRIEIGAESVFIENPLGVPPYGRAPQPGDSFVDASAPGGPEAQGVVVIRSPIVDIESQVNPLDASFLRAAQALQPSCVARASEGATGSFAVSRVRGLPSSADGLLIAYDDLVPPGAPGPVASATPDVAAAPPEASSIQVAQASLARGARAFRGGHFEQAAQEQASAAELLAQEGDPERRIDAVRALAQSQLALGRYAEAAVALEEAGTLAEAQGDAARSAAIEAGLGNAYLGMGDTGRAETHLERASRLASEAGDPVLGARIFNNLGNLRAVSGRHDAALVAYEESARLAARADRPVEEAKALSNGSRAALEGSTAGRAAELLARARSRSDALPRSHEQARVWIHVAASYERLALADPARRETALLAAHALLQSAIALARELEEPRALSSALGQLGQLYESEQRSKEALYLTRAALREAETASAFDLAYRWHWQEGRILWSQGQASAALRSYRRAVAILEETRQETLAQYGSAETRFRRAVAPVYVQLVDVLLESSGLVQDPADVERLLIEARRVMESLKAAELRDYFRDECVAEVEARAVDLDRVSRGASAAVVYPIILPDRLELLLSLPSGIARQTVPVPGRQVHETIAAYRRAVSSPADFAFRAPARQLYDWLVRPYAERLASEKVRTLVFVPDGALRTVPLAALHDGESFLVSEYALAVTPGLSLVDPRPLDTAGAGLLLAGVSDATQGFPALPSAARELEAIRSLYGGEVLLNEDFVAQRFERELAAERPTVVHVASHAVFNRDASESFLLTYDGRLTMDEMSDALVPAQFSPRPVELLALSACETAVGDERAALGLAGVAIRAGARSALGSLWRIDDEATYQLIVAFYEEVGKPGVSKAEALRRAQGKLAEDLRFSHPFYWSSFLLISNWL